MCLPFAENFPVFLACFEGCELAGDDAGEISPEDAIALFEKSLAEGKTTAATKRQASRA